MPKSQIIKDIVEDKVPLEQSLNRVFVLAKDIQNEPLAEWASKELNGYQTSDTLPDYRTGTSFDLKYTGINGRLQVKNQPLSRGWIDKEVADAISKIKIFEGIRYVSELASSPQSPIRDLTDLAGQVDQASDGGIQCVSIWQEIPHSFFQAVCSAVKSKMLIVLLELEKKYGNLDNLGIDISDQNTKEIEKSNAKLNKMILNVNLPQENKEKESLSDKIAWNIIVPIITGVIGAALGALITSYFGWG